MPLQVNKNRQTLESRSPSLRPSSAAAPIWLGEYQFCVKGGSSLPRERDTAALFSLIDIRGGGNWASELLHNVEALTIVGKLMIKLDYCITKKTGLTDEELFRYCKDAHGPIGARIPRLRKLVQSHRLSIPDDKYPADYDGMVELWFDNVRDLLEARQSPEWKASGADEVNFIDHSKVAYFVSEEHIIVGD
jgi:uncharacterized protein (TIGR02118 family)